MPRPIGRFANARGSLASRGFAACFLLLLLAVLPIAAQVTETQTDYPLVQRGLLPDALIVQSGSDDIDLASGNLIYRIPMYRFPGGGGSLAQEIGLIYNSFIYDSVSTENYTVQVVGTTTLSNMMPSTTGGGWRYSFEYSIAEEQQSVPCGGTNSFGILTRMSAIFPDGSRHVLHPPGTTNFESLGFTNETPSGTTSCPVGTPSTGTLVYFTDDGTYIRVEVNTANGAWTLFLPEGTQIAGQGLTTGTQVFLEPVPLVANATQISDRNGNFLSITANAGNFDPEFLLKDQLGRTVTLVKQLSANGQPIDIVTAPGVGQNLTWTVAWGAYISTDQTYYVTPCNVPGGSGNTCTAVPGGGYVSSIQLPSVNGEHLQYQFNYTINPGWGELASVVTPYGAVVSYQYLQYQLHQQNPTAYCINCRGAGTENSRVSQKTLAFEDALGVLRNQSWNITQNYGPFSGNVTSQFAVQAPDGGTTTTTFCLLPGVLANNPTPVAENCTILQPNGDTIQRTWARNCPFGGSDNSIEYTGNPYVSQETKTVNGQTSTHTYTYDRNGNMLSTAEYGWNVSTTTGSPTRTTANTFNLQPGSALASNSCSGATDNASGYWNSRTTNVLNAPTSKVVTGTSVIESRADFQYDSAFNLKQETHWRSYDSNGNSQSYSGYVTAPTSLNSVSISHVYDPGAGTLTSTTDANGTTTEYTLGICPFNDSAGHQHYAYPSAAVAAYQTTLSRTTNETWDCTSGLMLTSTDPNQVTTVKTYDSIGRVTKIAEASGTPVERDTAVLYNEPSSVPITTVPATPVPTAAVTVTTTREGLNATTGGSVTEIKTLDQRGELVLTQTTDLTQTGATQNPWISTQTLPKLGSPTQLMTYEAVSNPYRSAMDITMGWTRTAYDTMGRPVAVDHYDFSALPPPWGSNVRVSGSALSYIGSSTTTQDEALRTKVQTEDGLGRLQSTVEDPSGLNYLTTYSYDSGDRVLTTTQSSQGRLFVYDSLGHLVSATNPENGLLKYVYDPNGNVLKKTNAATPIGSTMMTYDALNRITGKTYSDGTAGVTYCYDGLTASGACTGAPTGSLMVNRLTMLSSTVSSTLLNSYDQFGEVTGSQQITAGQTYSPFAYTYNFLGELTSLKYPSGRIVNIGYDNAGRALSLQNGATGTYYANPVGYAANGAIDSLSLGNLVTETTTLDTRLQPTLIHATGPSGSLLELNYSYGTSNNNGNVQQATIGWVQNASIRQYFTYDGANRLLGAEENPASVPPVYASSYTCPSTNISWCQQYGYDNFGNRAMAAETGPADAISPLNPTGFNAATNQITTPTGWVYSGTSSPNVSGDPGNVIGSPGGSYQYDLENRMTVASAPGQGGAAYQYDGNGKRVLRRTCTTSIPCLTTSGDAITNTYVYDAAGNLAAEYKSCVTAANCVDLNQPEGTQYLTADALGTTRLATNGTASVTECRDYFPFGEQVEAAAGSSRLGVTCFGQNAEVRQQFTGKERDAETGLDYFGARYMSSAQGRFTSPDPIHIMPQKLLDPQQWNMYAYVRNNPLRFLDPTGMYIAGCDGDVKSCDKQISNFDKTLQNALKSKDQSVRDGAAAYGALGDKNGVNVNFTNVVDPKNANVVGQVTSQAGTGGFTYDEKTNTFQQATQVSIKAGLSGNDLQETAVHEGVHVEDRANFINSFSQGLAPDFSFHANYQLNITGRQSEVNAYSVENTLRRSLGDPSRNINDILAHPPYSTNPGMNRPILPGIVPANPQ